MVVFTSVQLNKDIRASRPTIQSTSKRTSQLVYSDGNISNCF